jgi:hypothetical protein
LPGIDTPHGREVIPWGNHRYDKGSHGPYAPNFLKDPGKYRKEDRYPSAECQGLQSCAASGKAEATKNPGVSFFPEERCFFVFFGFACSFLPYFHPSTQEIPQKTEFPKNVLILRRNSEFFAVQT